VAGYCECGDEPSGSCATELVSSETSARLHGATFQNAATLELSPFCRTGVSSFSIFQLFPLIDDIFVKRCMTIMEMVKLATAKSTNMAEVVTTAPYNIISEYFVC
jgi:hypothetical protein